MTRKVFDYHKLLTRHKESLRYLDLSLLEKGYGYYYLPNLEFLAPFDSCFGKFMIQTEKLRVLDALSNVSSVGDMSQISGNLEEISTTEYIFGVYFSRFNFPKLKKLFLRFSGYHRSLKEDTWQTINTHAPNLSFIFTNCDTLFKELEENCAKYKEKKIVYFSLENFFHFPNHFFLNFFKTGEDENVSLEVFKRDLESVVSFISPVFLYTLAKNDNREMVNYLIGLGASATSILVRDHYSICWPNPASDTNALHLACEDGNLSAIKLLLPCIKEGELDDGVCIDKAVTSENLELVKFLIEEKKVNHLLENVELGILNSACSQKNIELLDYILKLPGIDANICSRQWTPLIHASNTNYKAIEILLKHGADMKVGRNASAVIESFINNHEFTVNLELTKATLKLLLNRGAVLSDESRNFKAIMQALQIRLPLSVFKEVLDHQIIVEGVFDCILNSQLFVFSKKFFFSALIRKKFEREHCRIL